MQKEKHLQHLKHYWAINSKTEVMLLGGTKKGIILSIDEFANKVIIRNELNKTVTVDTKRVMLLLKPLINHEPPKAFWEVQFGSDYVATNQDKQNFTWRLQTERIAYAEMKWLIYNSYDVFGLLQSGGAIDLNLKSNAKTNCKSLDFCTFKEMANERLPYRNEVF